MLVAHKDRVQEVKEIVAALEADKRPQATWHRKVYRPWGSYDGIDSGERFQVKRIMVKPGAALSLQMHHHRAEHWIVVKGTAQRDLRREGVPAVARTRAPTSRSAASTGWRIPASSRWS